MTIQELERRQDNVYTGPPLLALTLRFPHPLQPHSWRGNQCSMAVTWQERDRSKMEMKTSQGSFQETIPGVGGLQAYHIQDLPWK